MTPSWLPMQSFPLHPSVLIAARSAWREVGSVEGRPASTIGGKVFSTVI